MPTFDDPVTDSTNTHAARYISVVFLQGSEADQVIDMILTNGPDAGIQHLAGYDMGEETVNDALENGYVYDTPPDGGMLHRTATLDGYHLDYSPFLSTVSLVREYHQPPDPALLDLTDRLPPSNKADWFAAPVSSSRPSQRLAL